MERLGIFVFFDKEGIVDSYIDYLLADLKKNLKQLIIVINGKINSHGITLFRKYSDEIIIRENKGFDIGAYKDVLVDLYKKKKLAKWDEIVLCNDTFYGPFVPFGQIFERMEQKQIDFWGLNYINNSFLSHIQSYFLVFRKSILVNGDLINYLEDNIDSETEDISEIYAVFEIGVFLYLIKLGYKFDTYIRGADLNIYSNADAYIMQYNLPILKKKYFSPKYLSEKSMINLLKYIDVEEGYDIKNIIKNVYRIYGFEIDANTLSKEGYELEIKQVKRQLKCIEIDEIRKFIQEHSSIYIYGTGIVAKEIWYIFHNDIKELMGFLVSDKEVIKKEKLYGYPVRHYSDIEGKKAILLGVGMDNTKEIYYNIKDKDEVLCLWEAI